MAGLWNYYLVLADYAQARKLAKELLQLAEATQDPTSLLAAHWALVEASFWTGDFDTTLSHSNQVVNFMMPIGPALLLWSTDKTRLSSAMPITPRCSY